MAINEPTASPAKAVEPTKKETTWDRITGPKLFKSVSKVEGIHAFPLVPLRVMSGLLMIHHGSEGGVGPANMGTPEFQGFVDFIVKPYFNFLPGPPELWSAIHDYAEFFGGICLVLGFLTRPAALALVVTMFSAVYFHLSSVGTQGFPLGHVPNYSYDFEEPTLYALIFLLFFFNGAGTCDTASSSAMRQLEWVVCLTHYIVILIGPLSVDSLIYSQISKEDD